MFVYVVYIDEASWHYAGKRLYREFSISQMSNAELARALAWRENEGKANVLSTPISRCVRIGIILTSVRYSSLHSMDILPFRGWLYHTARNSIQVCGYGRMSIR